MSDKCWAQIKAIIELNDGMNVLTYIKVVHLYVTTNDERIIEYVDKKCVLCFLCIVHLSKNFLNDSNNMLDDPKVSLITYSLFLL